MIKFNKNIIKYTIITKDVVFNIASKKTFWIFFVTLITSCGIDIEENSKTYLRDIGLLVFQILSKIF